LDTVDVFKEPREHMEFLLANDSFLLLSKLLL